MKSSARMGNGAEKFLLAKVVKYLRYLIKSSPRPWDAPPLSYKELSGKLGSLRREKEASVGYLLSHRKAVS